MSDIVPYRGGAISRASGQLAKRRIDAQTSLEAYRHDRVAELADHKRANIDWFTYERITASVSLGRAAVDAVTRCPAALEMVTSAIEARERALGRICRDLSS